MADDQGQTAMSSSIRRTSRSPRPRFARLRQTRVASLSPTPTLLNHRAVAGPIRGSSRTRGRTQSISPEGHGETRGTLRSVSRGRPLGDDEQIKETIKENDEHIPAQNAAQMDLEKGQQTVASNKDASTTSSPPPKPQLAQRLLPPLLLHFLGYRRPAHELPERYRHVKPYPSLLPFLHRVPMAVESLFFMFFGAFVGISIVQLVFARPLHFTSSTDVPPHAWAAPIIVGSFGASSVLLYATPNSPMGQPRVFMGGQFVSALMGVCITSLFKLAPYPGYDLNRTDTSQSLVWLAGALSVAASLVAMTMTGTLHPPGGATAVLCATNEQVSRMRWKILPVVLLSSALMVVWNLLWMNLGRRRYPETFTAPVPAKAQDGNLSQYLVDWLHKRWNASTQAKPAKESVQSTQASQGSSKTMLPATNPLKPPTQAADDGWQDEGNWKSASKEDDQRGAMAPPYAADRRQHSPQPVERPSRWAKQA